MTAIRDSAVEGHAAVPSIETGLPDRRARAFERLLARLAYGRLTLRLPSGESLVRSAPGDGPDATLVIRRWRALRRIAIGGDIGFAEGYIEGDWTSPDPVALIRLLARNSAHLRCAIRGSVVLDLLGRLGHRLRRNTKRGSRRNIEAHYDLGNEFYGLWLDPSMLYSSALYGSATDSLEAAQAAKLDRVRELLALEGGESVLEIGCGWGALATHLAEKTNGPIVGVTLSPAQLAFARDAIARKGLNDRVDLRLQDYRDICERFDRVVSIEMFEAVGEEYWSIYFQTLARALAPGGRAVLQVISIAEDRFEDYRNDSDFIQKYIFPGGFLPSKQAFAAAARREGLEVVSAEHFGLSYAETLAEWRRRFDRNWPRIERLEFDERFRRIWTYYLQYCEAGFREGAIDVGLYVLAHSRSERPDRIPGMAG